MDTAPSIRSAQPIDLDLLADILSDSFSNDPVMNWVIPMPELYPDFFKMIIEGVYLPKGIAHVDEQGRGCSLWLAPEQKFEMPARLSLATMIMRLVFSKGFRPLWNIREQGDFFARHHPQEPHYYLQFIGARQQDHGRGVGSALLKHGTRLCDEAKMPAYLESSNVRNVPLYQRHGFEVIFEGEIPGGPRVWFMWREPRLPETP